MSDHLSPHPSSLVAAGRLLSPGPQSCSACASCAVASGKPSVALRVSAGRPNWATIRRGGVSLRQFQVHGRVQGRRHRLEPRLVGTPEPAGRALGPIALPAGDGTSVYGAALIVGPETKHWMSQCARSSGKNVAIGRAFGEWVSERHVPFVATSKPDRLMREMRTRSRRPRVDQPQLDARSSEFTPMNHGGSRLVFRSIWRVVHVFRVEIVERNMRETWDTYGMSDDVEIVPHVDCGAVTAHFLELFRRVPKTTPLADGRRKESETNGFAAWCYLARGVKKAVPRGRTDNFGGVLHPQAGRQRCKRKSPATWRSGRERKREATGREGDAIERSDRCSWDGIPGNCMRESYPRTVCNCGNCEGSQLAVVGR